MSLEDDIHQALLAKCVRWLTEADALVITAGAGMGVDSGLPNFRGPEGFWRAYPALKSEGIGFTDIANPHAFERRPQMAWGFYGHRLKLYRETVPHEGFTILRRWAESLPRGAFVFTSNVDGQFQKAGFSDDHIVECHGSIHHLQCSAPCCERIWPADGVIPDVDEVHCQLRSPLPRCPGCGALARPNILMFGDWHWMSQRSAQQEEHLRQWYAKTKRPVVIELGAGKTISTVRSFSESLKAPLIRINCREADSPPPHVSLEMGALAALRAIDERLPR